MILSKVKDMMRKAALVNSNQFSTYFEHSYSDKCISRMVLFNARYMNPTLLERRHNDRRFNQGTGA